MLILGLLILGAWRGEAVRIDAAQRGDRPRAETARTPLLRRGAAYAALAQGVEAVHIVGRLAPGELVREMAEPGTVGTVLVAG